MTTKFDNMTTKQIHALLNDVREQNNIAVLKHAKSRDVMIAEIVKLSPVQSGRRAEHVTRARELGINAKVMRSWGRRNGYSDHAQTLIAYCEFHQIKM